MKKIITSIGLSLMVTLGLSAQNAPVDFETGGNGANWTWTVFENSTNPSVEIITNPDQTGANTSATVMKFTALQAGNPWAGCESNRGVDLGKFSWDATNRTVKIMVWKPVISDVGIKFISDSGWAEVEVKVANTKINEWEELTFDFSGKVNPPANQGMLSQIAIFPDFNARTGDNVCYIDNITFGSGTTLNEPTVAAPDPTFPAADVISLFSGVYTDSTVNTWRTSWSSGSLEDVQVAGNDVKKYASLGFVGIEPGAGNFVDATNMTHFNFSMWSPNVDTLRVKLVDWGADESFGGGDDTEDELEIVTTKNDTWYSVSLALADFAKMTSKNNIAQIILSSPNGAGVVYIDNIFFNKEASSVENVELKIETNVYPNPATEVVNIAVKSADVSLKSVKLISLDGKLIQERSFEDNTMQTSMNISDINAGMVMVLIETNMGTLVRKIKID